MAHYVNLYEIDAIRDWLSDEDHLPQNIDDMVIKKFLHCNYGDLEATKACIERFCTRRTDMTELYTDRDPMSPQLQTAYSITCMSTYQADDKEILIHQLDCQDTEKFKFFDILKVLTIQADYWLKVHQIFPVEHLIVLDVKDYAFSLLPKINVLFYTKFLTYLLECMPVRVKQVHIINIRIYSETIFSMVKSVLPAKICDLITFHRDLESLHKAIGKEYLPIEYNGDAPSMREQHKKWVKEIEDQREMFLNDDMWKVNIKNSKNENQVNEESEEVKETVALSFKDLSID